jgi:hypothetical protein
MRDWRARVEGHSRASGGRPSPAISGTTWAEADHLRIARRRAARASPCPAVQAAVQPSLGQLGRWPFPHSGTRASGRGWPHMIVRRGQVQANSGRGVALRPRGRDRRTLLLEAVGSASEPGDPVGAALQALPHAIRRAGKRSPLRRLWPLPAQPTHLQRMHPRASEAARRRRGRTVVVVRGCSWLDGSRGAHGGGAVLAA